MLVFLITSLILPTLAQEPSPKPAATVERKLTSQLMTIYGESTGRTVLMPGAMPEVMVSTNVDILADTKKAAMRIEGVMAENGFQITRIGDNFVRVTPTKWSNSPAMTQLSKIQLPQVSTDGKNPMGEFNLGSADENMFLGLYAELKQCTVLRPAWLVGARFHVRSQKPLSRAETVYALDTLMVLNGLVPVEDGEKLVQVVPLNQVSHILAKAPKPNSSKSVIEPGKVPLLTTRPLISRPKRPPQTLSQEITNFSAQAYTKLFGDPPDAQPLPVADRLARFYAKLVDKTYVPSKLGGNPILFEVRTPPTKEELIYAMETTFRLNHLKIIEVDSNSISLGAEKETKAGSDK
ncbi:hypothetical protein [Pedosphaera parvula]|nr:hypothetical protein [Pedosphaera parvula]